MSQVIRTNYLRFALSPILLLLAAGCSTAQFTVVDATTNEPLDGVQVDGYRFRPLGQIPADFAWIDLDVAPTSSTGETGITEILSFVPAGNEFRFVFSKPGYQSAEALVYPDRTLIASPAADADWKPIENDPHHLVGNIPTRNFVTVPSGGKIVVQLVKE